MEVAPAEEVEAVERVLRSLGIDGDIDAGIEHRGVGDYPWVVYVMTPIVAGFLGKLGADLYDGAKRLVLGIREARKDKQGSVVVRTRNPEAPQYGRYWLVSAEHNVVVYGGDSGADLAAIEAKLSQR